MQAVTYMCVHVSGGDWAWSRGEGGISWGDEKVRMGKGLTRSRDGGGGGGGGGREKEKGVGERKGDEEGGAEAGV